MSERLRTNGQWICVDKGDVVLASTIVWARWCDGTLVINDNTQNFNVHADDVAEAMRILGLEFHADTKEQTT